MAAWKLMSIFLETCQQGLAKLCIGKSLDPLLIIVYICNGLSMR